MKTAEEIDIQIKQLKQIIAELPNHQKRQREQANRHLTELIKQKQELNKQ